MYTPEELYRLARERDWSNLIDYCWLDIDLTNEEIGHETNRDIATMILENMDESDVREAVLNYYDKIPLDIEEEELIGKTFIKTISKDEWFNEYFREYVIELAHSRYL